MLHASAEPLIKRGEDMTGYLDQSLRNLWPIKWCLNLRECSVAIQNANTSEESRYKSGPDTAAVSTVTLVQYYTYTLVLSFLEYLMVLFKGLGIVASKGALTENHGTKYGKKETMNYIKVDYCPSICFSGRGMVVVHIIWCYGAVSVTEHNREYVTLTF
jgi:hypothetical protein